MYFLSDRFPAIETAVVIYFLAGRGTSPRWSGTAGHACHSPTSPHQDRRPNHIQKWQRCPWVVGRLSFSGQFHPYNLELKETHRMVYCIRFYLNRLASNEVHVGPMGGETWFWGGDIKTCPEILRWQHCMPRLHPLQFKAHIRWWRVFLDLCTVTTQEPVHEPRILIIASEKAWDGLIFFKAKLENISVQRHPVVKPFRSF